jgi:hypothetical protein
MAMPDWGLADHWDQAALNCLAQRLHYLVQGLVPPLMVDCSPNQPTLDQSLESPLKQQFGWPQLVL